jgi:hypothetical protein
VERAGSLASQFEVVPVLPPTEEEAIRMVAGAKEQYEKFHGVVFADEVIKTAVAASRWFLRHRRLPDRAIDLIDDAGARVKLRGERGNQQRLRAELGQTPPINVVSSEDVVEAVASRAGVPVEAVRNLLELKEVEPMELVARELAAQFPVGGLEWAEALASYLSGCSAEEAERFAAAIRSAQARLGAQ